MADVTKYQTNYSSESPEEKAKNLALEEAFVPESIGFILSRSSNTKIAPSSEDRQEDTSARDNIQNEQNES